jgi:hypothetical protein
MEYPIPPSKGNRWHVDTDALIHNPTDIDGHQVIAFIAADDEENSRGYAITYVPSANEHYHVWDCRLDVNEEWCVFHETRAKLYLAALVEIASYIGSVAE